MTRSLSFLFPLFAVLSFISTIAICTGLAYPKRTKWFWSDSISSYGEYPGVRYFIFSFGFSISSILLAASFFYRHKFILLPLYQDYSKKAHNYAKILELALYQCLFAGVIAIPTTIVMGFTNGIRHSVHIAFGVVSWIIITGYSIESALLVLFLTRKWKLLSVISILLSIISIIMMICWISIKKDAYEWFGSMIGLIVFILHAFELYKVKDQRKIEIEA